MSGITRISARGLLGNVGVAALGGAIGIPSAVLVGGAAVVFGCAGYGVAEMMKNFTPLVAQSTVSIAGFTGVSLVSVAVALIVDGARRILGSNLFQTIKSAVSSFLKGVLRLVKLACKVVLKSVKDLRSMMDSQNQRSDAAAGSAGAATITFLVSSAMTHAASWPILTLLTISSPVLTFLFRELYFRMDATDSEQFLDDFGLGNFN